MWPPTWRALPITPTNRAGDRSRTASDSATPGASWSVCTASVSAPMASPSRPGLASWPVSEAARSALGSTRTGSKPSSRPHRIMAAATGVAENTTRSGRRRLGSR